MNSSDSPKAIRDEALRKIGRNVLILQKMEGLLKYFATIARIEGNPLDTKRILEKNAKTVSRHTLGRLADTYIRTIHAKDAAPDSVPEDSSQPHISTTFRIESDENTATQRRKTLSTVVKERNRLIHKMLGEFQPDNFASCQELIERLDSQHQLIWPQYQILVSEHQTSQEIFREFYRHVQSDDFLS